MLEESVASATKIFNPTRVMVFIEHYANLAITKDMV